MTFTNAKCEVCKQDVFPPLWLVAYQVRDGMPERVALNGKQPWAGVRVVCNRCQVFLGISIADRVSPEPPATP